MKKKKYLLELLNIIKTKKYITLNQLKDDIDEFKKILKQEGNVYNKKVFELNFKGFFEKIGTIYKSLTVKSEPVEVEPVEVEVTSDTLIITLKNFNAVIEKLKELLQKEAAGSVSESESENGSVSRSVNSVKSENGNSVESENGSVNSVKSVNESGSGSESGSESANHNKVDINTIDFNIDGTKDYEIIGEPFLYILLNQILSFLILDKWLENDNIVIIASDNGSQTNIGTLNAMTQWKTYNDNTRSPNLQSELSIYNINKLSDWLYKKHKGKVFFEPIGTQNETHKFGENVAHVWGANINNFNLTPGTKIEGDGQARAFDTVVNLGDGTQKDGIFGVVSTPYQLSSDAEVNKHIIVDGEKIKLINKREWPMLEGDVYNDIYKNLIVLLNRKIPVTRNLKKKAIQIIKSFINSNKI